MNAVTDRRHEQTWVRVNAEVDEGLSELISVLNEVPRLQTVQSCQGVSGQRQAYVYFHYGPWEQLCGFVFGKLEPALREILSDDAILSVEAFGGGPPFGKLTFTPEATPLVTSGVRSAITNDRS